MKKLNRVLIWIFPYRIERFPAEKGSKRTQIDLTDFNVIAAAALAACSLGCHRTPERILCQSSGIVLISKMKAHKKEGCNKMRIRAFPMNMDESYVESTWELLRGAIQKIQIQNNSVLSFEELYRNAYTLVLHKHGDKLYNGLREVITEHLQKKIRMDVLKAMKNSNFLEVLNDAWNEHTTSMIMIRDILMYMDRVYVSQHSVDPVYDLGLILFRDEVIRYDGIRDNLSNTLLNMIMAERHGEAVHMLSVKNACLMLMALGIHARTVYEEDFENPFLQQSAEFFREEGLRYLSENNAGAYIQKVQQRINEESIRARHYLDAMTEVKIIKVLEEELISKNLRIIVDMENSGVVHMLTQDRYEDLNAMYVLLKRVPNGLTVMSSAMSNYLRQQGTALVHELTNGISTSPVQFIENLLSLKSRFDKFLSQAFENDSLFRRVISADFEYFLNLNPSSPEYLSLFIDDKLKKGSKAMSESDLENVMDRAMILFRHLQEKDVFERYYKQHLAKRLLHTRSLADDAEKSVIAKLRMECGCHFTSKIEGMFKDMQLSATINENIRNMKDAHPEFALPIDFSASVLTTGFWPTQGSVIRCILPSAANEAFEKFKHFYLSSHSGRILNLQPQLGTADLHAEFYPPSSSSNPKQKKHKHILCVSTYQMCILMLFNKSNQYTYKEIVEQTAIPEKDLKRALLSLIFGKSTQQVLCRESKGAASTGDRLPVLHEEDVFRVNEEFSSRLFRVKIQTLLAKGETVPEQRETRGKIEEERKLEVEAAIVRIMKSRQRLGHTVLLNEIVNQLKHRFMPSPIMIKKRIECLIERDYLSRDPSDYNIVCVLSLLADYNEQILYDDLLRGYNILERPVSNCSKPLVVLLELVLFQIVDVEEKNQLIQTNIWLKFTWYDYNLKWNPEEYGGISDVRFPAGKIWKPDVLLYNNVDPNFDPYYPSNLVVYSDGKINWIPPAIVRSSCKMDVTWFPFDDQTCCLKFGSWTYNDRKLVLEQGGNGWDMSEYIENGEWLLVVSQFTTADYPVRRTVKLYECCPDEPYSDVKYCLHIRRRTLYYGFNLIIPSLLISLMTLLGFILPVESGEKLTLEITILLSVCVFLTMVSQMTPSTSEAVSLIGVFFSSHMIVVSASVVFNVIVLNLHYRTQDTHRMGVWTRKVLLDWFPRILLMRRPLKSNSNIHSDIRYDLEPLLNRKETSIQRTNDICQLLEQLIADVRYIREFVKNEEEEQEARNDWKFAAMVVDRICLIAFSFVILVSTIGIFSSSPHITV
ncbi:Cullin-3 [Trichinella papuae]|uniref:Cullin-3 n=1 Tax=Trichinella papuae TaxID=268474 RepID=A0A0V1M5N3_9BILA|nr:Cullin-3 [Trichinella papuae]